MNFLSYLSESDLKKILNSGHGDSYRFLITTSDNHRTKEIVTYTSITSFTSYEIGMYQSGLLLGFNDVGPEEIKKQLFYDKVNELLK